MGQNGQRSQNAVLGAQWVRLQRGAVHHFFRKVQLYRLRGQEVAQSLISIELKSLQQLIDSNRYFQARSRTCTHPSLISLLRLELLDEKGNSVAARIEREMERRGKVNVNTVCNFDFFEGHCQKALASEKNQFNGQLRLCHEFYSNNLQFQAQRRKKKQQIFSEKELWDILEACSQGASFLVGSGFKEPLLSPLGIKLNVEGRIKIGEWQFAHFFEDGQQVDEDTNFLEEGQTFVHLEVGDTQKQSKREFDMLTHYYWPPEGTTVMQSTMALGRLPGSGLKCGQIFSLGMTMLHLILQRSLYQKETYSQRVLARYLEEAVSLRKDQKFPLTKEMIELLSRMLAWDPQERLTYDELEKELAEFREKISQLSRSIWSESLALKSVGQIQSAKSVVFMRDPDGSGSIDQGYGDESHPPQPELPQRPMTTVRGRIPECNFDYQKLDYTINRERQQWSMFEHRLSTSPSMQNRQLSRQLFKHSFSSFPAEVMQRQVEDDPNQQILCLITFDNKNEREATDEEEVVHEQNVSGVTDSIKLLDISNIKALNQSEKDQKSRQGKLFGQLLEGEDSFSTMLHGKNINIQAFLNESDSLLLKSSVSPKLVKQSKKEDQQLFTSPELMALIRSSAGAHQQRASFKNSRKEMSPEVVQRKSPTQMTYSSYVKEEFAKGWYEGGKMNGLRNGYGTFHYNEGGKYCGDWLNSQMHGNGTLYYADGRIAYQGEWKNDSLSGHGVLYNEVPRKLQGKFDYKNFDFSEDVWVYYEGQFYNDDKCGKGVLLLNNGERFEGEFKEDFVDGKGTFFGLEGEIIKGEWRENRLIRVDFVGAIDKLSSTV